MAVKLRLKRFGRKNHGFFRLNAVDSRSPRDGRVIEELGSYDPRNKEQSKQFTAKSTVAPTGWIRAQHRQRRSRRF